MRRILLFTIMFAAGAIACAADFALLDSLLAKAYQGESAPVIQATPDGENYALMNNGAVYAYSFVKGNVTDTLYDKSFRLEGNAPTEASRKKGTTDNGMPDIEGFVIGTERWILVYANREQIFRHSFRADWYLVDTYRREVRPLSSGGKQQSPLFSPDGRYVAFVRSGNIFIHKVDFNAEVQATTDGNDSTILNGVPDWLYEEEFACNRLMAWSPDSKQLAFVRLDQSNVNQFTFMHYGTFVGTGSSQWSGISSDALQLYPKAVTIHYPKAGETNAEASVHVYDTYYKTVKKMQLPEISDCYIPRLKFTTSEEELAIFRLNRKQTVLEMYYANPKSTICHSIYREEGRMGAVDYACIDEWIWTADGDMLVVTQQDGWRHIYQYDSQGAKKQLLTTGSFDVTRLYGIDELGNIFFQAADPSPMQRMIRMLNISSSKKVFTLSSLQGMHNAQFSANYKYFIDSYSSIGHPLKAEVVKANGKVLRTIIDNKKLQKQWAALSMPVKKVFHFRTERRDDLDGWIIAPKDTAGRSLPLVLVQYSGPGSQMVLDRWNPGWEYFLAKEGYVVACVDVRGAGGRGTAWRNKTYGQLGELEAQDLISAANFLGRMNFVDSERMAIWGWSYGGFQVLYTMSTDGHPFKAGISVAPVTDWRLYDSAYAERFMNRPQENETGYLTHSPLNMAEKLSGNLLLVSGTADDNVHFQNTANYVHRLIEADKDFNLLLFPDENHYIRQGNSQKYLYRKKFMFLEQQLKH